MAADQYIIYTEPATSTSYTSYVGAFSTGLSFAVGNLDGNGIPQGPQLSVTPSTGNLSLQSGDVRHAGHSDLKLGHGYPDLDLHGDPRGKLAQHRAHRRDGADHSDPRLDARNLVAGVYPGTVRISGQAGTANSPVDVTVNLTVTTPPSPRSTVSPTEVSLSVQSGQTATQAVQITNTGPGTLQLDRRRWFKRNCGSASSPSQLQGDEHTHL